MRAAQSSAHEQDLGGFAAEAARRSRLCSVVLGAVWPRPRARARAGRTGDLPAILAHTQCALRSLSERATRRNHSPGATRLPAVQDLRLHRLSPGNESRRQLAAKVRRVRQSIHPAWAGHRRRPRPFRRHGDRGRPVRVPRSEPPQRGRHRPLFPRWVRFYPRRGRRDHGARPAGQRPTERGHRPHRGVPRNADRRIPGAIAGGGDEPLDAMTTPTRLTLLLAGLLIALTYLLMPNTSPDTMRYDRAFDGLRALMLDEATLHSDVLKARAGLLRNYDPLVQSVEGLHRAVDTLRSTEMRGEIDQRIEGVAAAVANQEALVEAFKSRNALLQNSLSYFAHTIQQFEASAASSRAPCPRRWESWRMRWSGSQATLRRPTWRTK